MLYNNSLYDIAKIITNDEYNIPDTPIIRMTAISEFLQIDRPIVT
jgi:hypothetical protein